LVGSIVIYVAKQNKFHRLMLPPVSHRHRHLTSQLVQTSFQVRRRRLDHQVRQAISIVAAAVALLLAVLSSPAPELQAVDVPTLRAKS
jgi:hypothetical protein